MQSCLDLHQLNCLTRFKLWTLHVEKTVLKPLLGAQNLQRDVPLQCCCHGLCLQCLRSKLLYVVRWILVGMSWDTYGPMDILGYCAWVPNWSGVSRSKFMSTFGGSPGLRLVRGNWIVPHFLYFSIPDDFLQLLLENLYYWQVLAFSLKLLGNHLPASLGDSLASCKALGCRWCWISSTTLCATSFLSSRMTVNQIMFFLNKYIIFF